jgi:hypothetical protein
LKSRTKQHWGESASTRAVKALVLEFPSPTKYCTEHFPHPAPFQTLDCPEESKMTCRCSQKKGKNCATKHKYFYTSLHLQRLRPAAAKSFLPETNLKQRYFSSTWELF